MKAICKKYVPGYEYDGPPIFTKDWVYESANPETWPDPEVTICLIDNEGDNHFMSSEFFHENFTKIENYMVKASELRLGNLVYNPTLSEFRSVDYLDIRDLAEGRLHNPFQGIVLTKTLLINFGFRLIGKDWAIYGVIIHSRKRGFVLRKSVPDIVYVHQLQNLIFALTGKELVQKQLFGPKEHQKH